MLFYDPIFFIIFPAFYVLYVAAVTDHTGRKWTLLIASALFYIWAEPLFVIVLFTSMALDFALSRYLTQRTPACWRKLVLAAGIGSNLMFLSAYKYADFLLSNANLVLRPLHIHEFPLLHLALPIGVSFVVFEKISYLLDTYRGISPPARKISEYALFVFFFPKLLAGPILKYHELGNQLAAPPATDNSDLLTGFLRFARGLGRKLLIADPLGTFADQIFRSDATSMSSSGAWLGLLAFTLQIYFDFSGYSDMAIGIARMLGIRLSENFNAPYVSQSLTEFWQRWHISLTAWIRDYLYVPLGGNRLGRTRTYFNLWLCFLLSGLWHGAAWNFVLWGAYNGFFLMLDRLFLRRWLDRCGRAIATAITLLIVMFGWAIFRVESLAHLDSFVAALMGQSRLPVDTGVPQSVLVLLILASAISLFPATPFYAPLVRMNREYCVARALGIFLTVAIFTLAAARTLTQEFHPFIYFQF